MTYSNRPHSVSNVRRVHTGQAQKKQKDRQTVPLADGLSPKAYMEWAIFPLPSIFYNEY